MRLPGRHHSRDYWSRVWDGTNWLAGHAAIDFVLALRGDSPDLVPDLTPKEKVRVSPFTNGHSAFRLRVSSGSTPEDRCRDYVLKTPIAVSGKKGHSATMWMARVAAYGFDLGADVAFRILRELWNPRCQPPWSDADLYRKCQQADTTPFQKPRGWLLQRESKCHASRSNPKKPAQANAFQSFPTQSLARPMFRFVREAAGALYCDEAYVALPAISAALSCIGNSRVIQLKRDWYEPAVGWTVIVGDSGTLKSPAIKQAIAPLFRIQHELVKAHKQEMKEWSANKAAFEKRRRQAEKDNKPFDTEMGPPPTIARLIVNDTTVEGLGALLESNPRGLLCYRDDLSGWFNSFRRYKDKGGSDVPNWLEFFRAETTIIDRKSGDKPTLIIPRANVSVLGGIQPATLARSLTPEYFENGLVARLLLAMSEKKPKRWTDDEISLVTKDDYEKMLRGLQALKMDVDDEGDLAPFVLRMTPDARDHWIAFYNEWAEEQNSVDGDLAACYSKLEAYAARLALLHHVASHVHVEEFSDPLEPVSIEAGITLAKWFAAEARRIYVILGETKEQRLARRLVNLIRARGGKITVRELQRADCTTFKTANDAEAALQAMVEEGLGVWENGSPPEQGGHALRRFILHDMTHDTRSAEEDEPPARALFRLV
jgi:hypothetical protein